MHGHHCHRFAGLHTSLGFEVAEPVALICGRPRAAVPGGVTVRPLVLDDVAECERLCRAVHGYDRTADLRDALAAPGIEPVVAVRGSRVVAYATTLTADFGLAYAEADRTALVAGTLAATDAQASFLLSIRQHEFFRWCLQAGLRVVKPMTYMTVGAYRLPSVLR